MKLLKPLVLASSSPRRLILLRQIGMRPIVVPSDVPEEFDAGKSPVENATELAFSKAKAVSHQFDDAFVVGADTIVLLDGELLAKPVDHEDARRMLKMLSGRTHTVITGLSIIDCPSGESTSVSESTEVTFRVLPDAEIAEYVAGGSPMDKAGAYGIQDDYGAVFVTRIVGCFYNVMGFPLSRFYSSLEAFQASILNRKEERYVGKN